MGVEGEYYTNLNFVQVNEDTDWSPLFRQALVLPEDYSAEDRVHITLGRHLGELLNSWNLGYREQPEKEDHTFGLEIKPAGILEEGTMLINIYPWQYELHLPQVGARIITMDMNLLAAPPGADRYRTRLKSTPESTQRFIDVTTTILGSIDPRTYVLLQPIDSLRYSGLLRSQIIPRANSLREELAYKMLETKEISPAEELWPIKATLPSIHR